MVKNTDETLICTCGITGNLPFLSKVVFLVVLSRWKRTLFKFHLKEETINILNINFSFIWWATLLTNNSYEPYETYLIGSTFLLYKDVPKKHFCHFRHRGETHFLVLAQTLLYLNLGCWFYACPAIAQTIMFWTRTSLLRRSRCYYTKMQNPPILQKRPIFF